MTDGDGDDRESVVPRPRGPVRLVGRRERSPAARNRSTTAVLDVVAPPWLRVPSGDPDDPARPAECRPAGRRQAEDRRAEPRPVVLRVVADEPAPVTTARPPLTRPAATRPAAAPVLASHPARARPPVSAEPGILGLSRLTRGRVGSRLFTLSFVAVFALILVQMLVAILYG
jgi:hypothetical protein